MVFPQKAELDDTFMNGDDTSALQLRGLTKRFDRLAVDALDLTVHAGEFYALVGPNGAGKTTTLRMVAGLLKPDAGSVDIFGIDALRDPVAAKQMMAWVSDEPMIYDKLTPTEYLEFVAGLWGIEPRISQPTAQELLASSRIGTSAARAFPRACARRWRSPARWCTIPG
jgi:ABC-2 type transport system ATP-binding protein